MIPLRIMLVDDHPLIREAIGHLIAEAPDFELVGEAADGKECLARVEELRPDIVVLDIAMPLLNGEQVARELRRRYPALKIVALSGYADRQFVRAIAHRHECTAKRVAVYRAADLDEPARRKELDRIGHDHVGPPAFIGTSLQGGRKLLVQHARSFSLIYYPMPCLGSWIARRRRP